ncbi:hypothetical protein VPH35_058488 [Triticum aestivum]|uniref:protein ANTAGONIST OF LIKE HETEROCHROMATIN PROTEIN 1-like n=1 Tax=Triticum aestivum TaxID=4565 RepID=UPI0008452005|nr:protein ANTAGONIST OF LIKE HETEROCHROMATIN PROTEIN 1-like [Triticum aestivum]
MMRNQPYVGSHHYSTQTMADGGDLSYLDYYFEQDAVSESAPAPVNPQGSKKRGASAMEVEAPQGQGVVNLWNEMGAREPGFKRQNSLWESMDTSGGLALHVVESSVGFGVPHVQGMVNLGAEWMGGVPSVSGARGSKRQRSPSGSMETASGVDSNEDGGSEIVDEYVVLATVTREKGVGGGGRRLWKKDRHSAWWDTVSSSGYPAADFRHHFRMSPYTFQVLCEQLAAAVRKEDTALRAAIPVQKRVAVCVWRLATGEPLRKVADRFAIGVSTCHKLVLDVCAAIQATVVPNVIQWPDAATMATNAAKFEALSGIPGIIGAVHTTHVAIIAPKHHVINYLNPRATARKSKTCYSITLQASVDADGTFTDICVSPGAMADEQTLLLWSMNKPKLTEETLGQGMRVVGGAGYPLTDWMLVPYSHQNLTWTQHEFNQRLAKARAVAVTSFQRLKARWACLQRRTEVKVDDLSVMLGACCTLHNICEHSGEPFDLQLLHGVELDLDDDNHMVANDPVPSPAAAQMRDTIAHNMLHHATVAGAGSFY